MKTTPSSSFFFTYFIAFSLLLNSHAAVAQTTLSGSIRTTQNKPLPFANVALLSARDSSLVKGAISQETGFCTSENVRPGQYRMQKPLAGTTPAGYRAGRYGLGYVTRYAPACFD